MGIVAGAITGIAIGAGVGVTGDGTATIGGVIAGKAVARCYRAAMLFA